MARDNNDHSTGTPTNADDSNHGEQSEQDARLEILAKKEQRAVVLIRSLTIWVLVVSAVALCLTVNVYLNLEESNDFQEAFFEQSVKLTEAVAHRLEDRISSIDYFEMTLVSHSLSMGISSPKLYVPHFEQRANKTSTLAHSISLSLLPIVTGDTRLDYDNFSVMMQGWIPEGLAFQEQWADSSWAQPDDWEDTVGEIEPTIGTLTSTGERVVATGPGPFLPKWQSSPALDDLSYVSLDLLSHPGYEKILKAGLESGRVIIGETYDPFEENESPEAADKHEILKKYLQRWREVGNSYEDDPVTDLVFPIYDGFFGDLNLVGLVHSHIYLRNYLSEILIEGEGPVVATFENSCGQTHSYEIEGHDVSYLGTAGSLEYSDEIHEMLTPFQEMHEYFKADEIVDGECAYSLRLAPHGGMSGKFASQDPVIYTVILACVFLFTSFVFLAYDLLVERRQRKVMAKALQSGNIVSSLFPKAVRDRMYGKPSATQEKQRPEQAFNGKASQLTNMMDDELNNDILSSEPVADLYPNCTVLFADLKGFTQWSADRAPTDVFKLLETLYMNFDNIAKRRRVFKVETIGDCYVAVAGLPTPQDKHAVIMTKFANECMTRMSYVLPDLVDILGEDVAELSMRVGLHSGPVTAGVLRGEKGRFQLFGDTVNTAARMESSGQGGRIHISEATAQALRLGGFHEWVSPCEEMVNPKGKGLMQTYWAQAPLRSKSVSSSGHSVGTSNSAQSDSEEAARWDAADRREDAAEKEKAAASEDDGGYESDAGGYASNRGGHVSDLGYASNRGYATGSEEAIERVRAKLHARLAKGERN
jgi:class 3 adenylate cyclase